MKSESKLGDIGYRLYFDNHNFHENFELNDRLITFKIKQQFLRKLDHQM